MVDMYVQGNKVNRLALGGKVVASAYKNGIKFYDKPRVPVVLANLLSNGSFESNTTGWSGSLTLSRQSKPASNSEYGSYTSRVTGRVNGTVYLNRSSSLSVTNGRKYYIRAKAYVTLDYAYTLAFANNSTTTLTGFSGVDVRDGEDNGWTLYDGIWTANSNSLRLRLNFSGGSGSTTRTIYADNIMIFDLTNTFGSGDEPTVAEMRELVTLGNGYWDGSKTV